jgi:hypothetical protein
MDFLQFKLFFSIIFPQASTYLNGKVPPSETPPVDPGAQVGTWTTVGCLPCHPRTSQAQKILTNSVFQVSFNIPEFI